MIPNKGEALLLLSLLHPAGNALVILGYEPAQRNPFLPPPSS